LSTTSFHSGVNKGMLNAKGSGDTGRNLLM
jgi:hypothetical protein